MNHTQGSEACTIMEVSWFEGRPVETKQAFSFARTARPYLNSPSLVLFVCFVVNVWSPSPAKRPKR